MADAEAPQPAARPPQPSGGAGAGTFLFALLLLSLTAGAMWLHHTGRLQELLAKPQPQAPLPAPAQPIKLAAPAKVRVPDTSAVERARGSVGFVGKDEKVAGVADRDQEYPESLGRVSSGDRLSRLMEGEGPPVSFSGDGGPDRFEGRLVRSARDWQALWREVGGHDIPDLDFNRKMAVAVFAGRRPKGSAVEIASARPRGQVFLVEYRLSLPRARAPLSARPYHVVTAPKSKLRAVFRQVE